MILRNLTRTFEIGLIKTCLFPAFSALMILLKASDKTPALVIFDSERSIDEDEYMKIVEVGVP